MITPTQLERLKTHKWAFSMHLSLDTEHQKHETCKALGISKLTTTPCINKDKSGMCDFGEATTAYFIDEPFQEFSTLESLSVALAALGRLGD